ncbi:hypothetical protein AALO_G00065410, partial [Alosa alosa]
MAFVYTITTGETLNTHESFKSHLPWGSCKNVSNITDCDIILAFCPVTSRVGTDIEAALRAIPEGKPLALVVLHHTFDSNYTLPDTKRFMKRPGSITVDCLFTDDGLMRCPCNDGAVRAVAKFLQQHGKHSLKGKLALGLLILILLCVAFAKIAAEMEREAKKCREQAAELIPTKKELELMQQNYKTLEGELIKTINSHKKEVESYKELNRKANEKMNSLEEEVENCKELYRKANEKINLLEEQASHDTAIERNDEKDKQPDEKEASNLKNVLLMLSLLILSPCCAYYYIYGRGKRGQIQGRDNNGQRQGKGKMGEGGSGGAERAGDSGGAKWGGDSGGAQRAGDSGGAKWGGDSGEAERAGGSGENSGGAKWGGDSG